MVLIESNSPNLNIDHAPFSLVRLENGSFSINSRAHGETFHPVIGPVAEAEALYVNQLKLRERLKTHSGEFVIWDVGLGAAANAITVLRATRDFPSAIRLVSFDYTIEPLEFALQNSDALGYFGDYECQARALIQYQSARFIDGLHEVDWQLRLGDFPTLLSGGADVRSVDVAIEPEQSKAGFGAPPHAILFDAYSPAKNPAMWTLPLFSKLFQKLDPARPCALPTYSRSTILRVTLLLAGFFVGVGHATGKKEETTIAANRLELIEEPLDARWLDRARRSHSAEPMVESVYRIAPLTPDSWDKLRAHPQFC